MGCGVANDCSSSVTHAWFALSVAEVLTGATIALTGGVTYNILLLRNVSRVTRNLQSAIHFKVSAVSSNKKENKL